MGEFSQKTILSNVFFVKKKLFLTGFYIVLELKVNLIFFLLPDLIILWTYSIGIFFSYALTQLLLEYHINIVL